MVKGAEKGDVIAVHIESMLPRGSNPRGTCCLIPRFGALTGTDFTALFLMLQRARPGDLANNPSQLSRSMEMFDRLKPDTARKVVERWKINPFFLKSIRRLENQPHK